jgi:hypothetical protein
MKKYETNDLPIIEDGPEDIEMEDDTLGLFNEEDDEDLEDMGLDEELKDFNPKAKHVNKKMKSGRNARNRKTKRIRKRNK